MTAFSYERRVEFCETDSAGIAHFSSLAIYMEQAEHALFRSIGLSVFPQRSPSHVSSHLLQGTGPSQPSSGIKDLGNPLDHVAASSDVKDGIANLLDVTWPRVHISVDFLGPARFEEVLRIDVVVARLGESSVTFEHVIHGPNHPVARGTSTSVCCRIDRDNSHGLIKQSIPQRIRDKLTAFLRS